MARTQVTGTEIGNDTLTGDDVKEETLVDSKIPFSEAGFSALNVHDAIVEAKSGESDDNFSYRIIENGKAVNIPFSQQMLVFQDLKILSTGSLTISGECVICH